MVLSVAVPDTVVGLTECTDYRRQLLLHAVAKSTAEQGPSPAALGLFVRQHMALHLITHVRLGSSMVTAKYVFAVCTLERQKI